MKKLFCLLFPLLLGHAGFSQAMPPQPATPVQPAALTPPAPAASFGLTAKVQSEQDLLRKYQNEATQIVVALRNIPTMQSVDNQLQECIRQNFRLSKIDEQLQDAIDRQAEIGSEIRIASQSPLMTPQEKTQLTKASQALTALSKGQTKLHQKLKDIRAGIENVIQKLPMPDSFTAEKSGIRFFCVKTKYDSAYISERCVSNAMFEMLQQANKEGKEPDFASLPAAAPDDFKPVTHAEAKQVCQWLGAAEHYPFQLPNRHWLEQIDTETYMPPCAVWTREKGNPEGSDASRTRERFPTMTLFYLWDPRHVLSEETFPIELPQASYKRLGMILMLQNNTIKRLRFDNALKAVLDSEEFKH